MKLKELFKLFRPTNKTIISSLEQTLINLQQQLDRNESRVDKLSIMFFKHLLNEKS